MTNEATEAPVETDAQGKKPETMAPPKKKSSPIFLLLMLLVLGLFIAAYCHDQYMLPEKTANAFNVAGKLGATPSDARPDNAKVAEELGLSPSSRPDVGGYQVERFTLRRFLPIADSDFIEAVYKDGKLFKIVTNKEFNPDAEPEIRTPENYTGKKVELSTGGGGGGGGDDSDDDDSEDEDDSDEEEGDE